MGSCRNQFAQQLAVSSVTGNLIPRKCVGSGSQLAAIASALMTLPEPSGYFLAPSSCCHQRSIEVLSAGEGAQYRRHVGQITQLEPHITGMAGRGRSDVAMAQRVRNRAIAAGAFTKHAATPGTAATVALLDSRQHLMQEKILPGAHRCRVDVLVATEPCEAIRKGHDDRRHAFFANQPVEPLR